MTHTHLTEAQLIALCVPGAALSERRHAVAGCASCESRLISLDAMLEEVSTVAESQADAAFPPERLARQHAQILHRLEQHRRMARVLAFPHARRPSMPARPMRRWVAGAAAAGLLVGMLAGHLVHEIPGLRLQAGDSSTRDGVTPVPLHASATSDDDFLFEIEQAVNSGPESLRRLDRLTPVAWEQR
jgi:anti-sigma factor RsiW